jgi:hypothetical protein
MATVNVTASEFADVAMIWLFDQVMNPEQVQNENLKEFIKDHKGKLKSPLMAYYFSTDQSSRFDYRRIGSIFEGKSSSVQQIRIYPDDSQKENKKKKEGKIKTAVKRAIKKVLAKEELTLEDINMLKEIENDYGDESER